MYSKMQLKIFFLYFLLINTSLPLVSHASTYHLFRAGTVGSPPQYLPNDFPTDNDNCHSFLHWHDDIFYKLNVDIIPDSVTLTDVEEAISSACATWSEVNNCWMDATYNDTTTHKNDPNDGVNTIYWNVGLPDNIWSRTYITNQSSCNNQLLKDVDIEFNANKTWYTDGTPQWDIQTIMLHEMGHGFGIAHTNNPDAVMHDGIKDDGVRRSLINWDEWALQYLYPQTRTFVPDVYPGVKSAIQIDGNVDVDVESGSYSISGSFSGVDNLTIMTSASLTVSAGTTLDFTSSKKLTVNGTLVANGTSGSRITMTASSGTWGGVKFEDASSSSSLEYCIIRNTSRAVDIDNADLSIELNEIYDCSGYGIYIYDAEPTIYNNYLHDTDDYGIAANGAGNTYIRKNSIIGCKGGVVVWGNNAIKLRGTTDNSYGLNKIDNWGNGSGVYVLGGTPDLGQYSPTNQRGYNDILRDSQYAVDNRTATEVDAEKNYWGGSPQSSWFYGYVNYDFPVASSQGAGSDLEKPTGMDPDKELLVQGNDLLDAGRFKEASAVYKSLIDQFPESRHGGKALAWAMAAEKSAGDLESQSDYLLEMTKHQNPSVSGKAFLWLQTVEALAGNKLASKEIVDSVPIDDPIGWEIRLNWANDLLNVYGDSVAAEEVFGELQNEYSDQVTSEAIQIIRKAARKSEDVLLPKPKPSKLLVNLPQEFSMSQNYPNPFNPVTSFHFTLPIAGQVTIRIFDVRGREMESLLNTVMPAGEHKVTWNGKDRFGMDAPSGIYFYQAQFNEQVLTGKMTLVQ